VNDRAHFDEYREQTRVKHEILEKYLNAYFHVLKRYQKNLVYLDGFAGPGAYDTGNGSMVDGSPLRALRLIAGKPDFAERVVPIFFERDKKLYSELQARLDTFYAANPHIKEPEHANCTFKKGMEDLLGHFEGSEQNLAPTFLFVDPCGVAGVVHDLLVRFMQFDRCELFIFFNHDGVRRILGLEKRGPTLAELFGSDELAQNASDAVDRCEQSSEKENVLIAFYYDLIKQTIGTEFVTGFRVEKEDRKTVSHYFIHVTRSPTGFRIMKDVMWGLGETETGRGGLALAQASKGPNLSLVDQEWDALRSSVLAELSQPKLASYFYKGVTEQPGNVFCEAAYRQILLELEAQGAIQVIDKDGQLTSASTRRKRNKKPTLGEKHTIVRVPEGT